MILSLRSHLFVPTCACCRPGKLQCDRSFITRTSDAWLTRALSHFLLPHTTCSPASKSHVFLNLFPPPSLSLSVHSARGPLCLSGPLNGWQISLVCEWLFGWLALLMVCGQDDRLTVQRVCVCAVKERADVFNL